MSSHGVSVSTHNNRDISIMHSYRVYVYLVVHAVVGYMHSHRAVIGYIVIDLVHSHSICISDTHSI